MKNVFLYLMALLVLAACRSTRSDTATLVTEGLKMHDEMGINVDASARGKAVLQQWMEGHEAVDIDFTVYRPPDSAGRQSVLAVGKATKNRQQKAAAAKQTDVVKEAAAEMQQQRNIEQQQQQEFHQQKSKDSKFSGFKFYITTGLFLLLLFFIFKNKNKWLH